MISVIRPEMTKNIDADEAAGHHTRKRVVGYTRNHGNRPEPVDIRAVFQLNDLVRRPH
jgi:hypothetical protein